MIGGCNSAIPNAYTRQCLPVTIYVLIDIKNQTSFRLRSFPKIEPSTSVLEHGDNDDIQVIFARVCSVERQRPTLEIELRDSLAPFGCPWPSLRQVLRKRVSELRVDENRQETVPYVA
jgi:hypothetical protein